MQRKMHLRRSVEFASVASLALAREHIDDHTVDVTSGIAKTLEKLLVSLPSSKTAWCGCNEGGREGIWP